MAKRINNAFRTVKIKASSFASGDTLQRLEHLYLTLEAKKTDAVEAFRKATNAAADATIKESQRVQAEVNIISEAGTFNDTIASERRWLVFKENGEIIFEGLTDRLMRNNLRAQQNQIGKSIGDDDDFNNMFEESEETDD